MYIKGEKSGNFYEPKLHAFPDDFLKEERHTLVTH